jgi:alpha-methylacyl-CoA racemase
MPDSPASKQARAAARLKPLKGITVLSLALNLPGPAALLRCRELGAKCVKLEPPPPKGAPAHASGDPMSQYCAPAYAALQAGIRVRAADLKTEAGQRALHRELAKADVLLTSFRPSAMAKLSLGWKALHQQYPQLSQIAIVGAPGALAEVPGHDLTYLAENDLVTGLNLPATLYADMGGSLMAVEAVLQEVIHRATKGKGVYLEVALSEAASWLGLPRAWGLTKPGAAVGGGHAGYRVYACKDGRVAVAALEPHFAARLCEAAGIDAVTPQGMFDPHVHRAIESFFRGQTRRQLESTATKRDIPLHTLLN